MSDDFVLSVKQVGQYPAAASVNPANGDVLLMQQGGAGGAYQALNPLLLFSTALVLGGNINLAPSGGIFFNGVSLTAPQGAFIFSSSLEAQSIVSLGAISAGGNIVMAGELVATQTWVQGQLALMADQPEVNTFNGRTGFVQLMDVDILRAGGVMALNSTLGGIATAPTVWDFRDCSDRIATTHFVQGAITNAGFNGLLVQSFNGRGGCVLLTADDITFALTQPGSWGMANTPPSGDTSSRIATTLFVDDAMTGLAQQVQSNTLAIVAIEQQQFAPINSPQFTGIPTAPTAAQSVNSGQLATTAFVHAAVTASTTGVASFNTRTGAVVLTTADVTGVGAALLASPAFTGTPTSPTAAPGDNTTKIATTAFVTAAIGSIASGVVSFNTRTGAVTLTTADVTAVGGALLASPTFTGTPAAPTAAPGTNTTQVATTAFVTQAVAALPAPVTSFNGRTGAVNFQASDISAVNGALLASPAFTGAPTAPTATAGTSNTQLATTAFVAAAIAASVSGVSSWNGRTGAVVLGTGDITGAGGALLAGPTFTGVPSAPTATAGTNTTQLATTAFVQAALAAAPGGVSSFNGRTGAITLLGADVSAAGGALIASPTFTGTPAAPTAAPGTNTTQLATTAFVVTALAGSGGVTSFNGRAGVVTLNLNDILGASGQQITAVAATSPVSPAPTTGNLWLNTANNALSVYNGTAWVAPAAGLSAVAVSLFNVPGTSTWTPVAGMKFAMIECIGGGGGGGGSTGTTGFVYYGGGGGAGGYSRRWVSAATVGASQVVVVAPGGIAGTSVPGAGGNGGVTYVGAPTTLCGANGGSGGPAYSGQTAVVAGGAGGGISAASVGDITIPGTRGGNAGYMGNGVAVDAKGAPGPFGGGVSPPDVPNQTAVSGNSAITPGGGGSGGVVFNVASNAAGGGGSPGICIITQYA